MSKPNYGRVTSRLLDAIAALNESATDAVSRADELAAIHNASAMREDGSAGLEQYKEGQLPVYDGRSYGSSNANYGGQRIEEISNRGAAAAAAGSAVVDITSGTWDEIADGSKSLFVSFYAPWCGHCTLMKPHFDELGERFGQHRDAIVIARVDCTQHEELRKRFGVEGFPTIKLFMASDMYAPIAYTGRRTTAAMAEFLESKLKLGLAAPSAEQAQLSRSGSLVLEESASVTGNPKPNGASNDAIVGVQSPGWPTSPSGGGGGGEGGPDVTGGGETQKQTVGATDAVAKLKAALNAFPELKGYPGLFDDDIYRAFLSKAVPHIENPTDADIAKLADSILPELRSLIDEPFKYANDDDTISLDQVREFLVSQGTHGDEAARIATMARTSTNGRFSFSDVVRLVKIDRDALTLAVSKLKSHLGQNRGLMDEGTCRAVVLCRIPDLVQIAEDEIKNLASEIRTVLKRFEEIAGTVTGTVSLSQVCTFLVNEYKIDATRAWIITYAATSNGKLTVSDFVRVVMVHAHLASGAGPETTQVAALTAENARLTTLIAELEGNLASAMKMKEKIRNLEDMLSSANSSNAVLASELDQAMSECAKLKKQADALELERLRREYEELNNKSDRQLKELNVSSQTILTLEAKVRKVEAESGNATKAQQQLRQDLDRSRVDLETALVEKSRLQDKFDNLRSFLSAEEASPNKASDGVKVDIDAEGEENDSKGEYLT